MMPCIRIIRGFEIGIYKGPRCFPTLIIYRCHLALPITFKDVFKPVTNGLSLLVTNYDALRF